MSSLKSDFREIKQKNYGYYISKCKKYEIKPVPYHQYTLTTMYYLLKELKKKDKENESKVN